MRDFPFFTTENGVASLTLKEIPYRQEAYIRILEAKEENLPKLLEECAAFCRMAGAERIYAAGHSGLADRPLHTAVVEMRCTAWVDSAKLQNLFPVTQATVGSWRAFYAERMARVPMAKTLERGDEQEIVDSGGAYFVHCRGEMLGIGWLDDCRLLAMAAVSGAGERVMHTLMSLVEGDTMLLEVAAENTRAVRLYEKLGFTATREVAAWYVV